MTDEYKANFLLSIGYVEVSTGVWAHTGTEHGVPKLLSLDLAFALGASFSSQQTWRESDATLH